MEEPEFSVDEAAEIASYVDAHLTGWTWPEMQRALIGAGLTAELADSVGQRLFDVDADGVVSTAGDEIETRIVVALRGWTVTPPVVEQPPAPAVLVLSEPASTGRVLDDLPDIYDVERLAHWLNFTVPELEWFADRGRWLRHAREPLRHYRTFRVEKRDGFRVIEAPKPRMRETQRRLLRRLVERIPPHPAARGFVRGSSTTAFAWPHTDRPVVLRVDLRHCFESIDARRVRRVFSGVGYSSAIARILTELCTTATPPDALRGLDPIHAGLLRERHLPQGAPTSPHLANLVLRGLDRRLAGFAARNDLRYTRYGDDLALSGDRMDADRVLWTLLRVVADEGFTVHPAKTRVMYAHQQQRLAGLVVNDHPQVSRADHDALRALLHNAIRTGGEAQNRDGHADFRAHVYGKIAWIGASNAARRDKLLDMASRVDW